VDGIDRCFIGFSNSNVYILYADKNLDGSLHYKQTTKPEITSPMT